MKRSAILAGAIALFAQPALADGTGSSGASALALAALVGPESPTLSAIDKQELGDVLNGDLNFPGAAPINVPPTAFPAARATSTFRITIAR